ncbi:MAG: hypothetical protein WCB02_32310 [Bradyrhizobium sp.]
MLFPHGPDILGCREFATLDLGFGQAGVFLGCQRDRRLIDTCELQHHARELVLPRVGESGNSVKSLLK